MTVANPPVVKLQTVNGRLQSYPASILSGRGVISAAALAAAVGSSSGGGSAWATEGWESKTLNINPDGTNTDIGGVTWVDSFYTYVRNTNPKSGSRTLAFEFGAYDGSISEQGFRLNQNVTDIWIKYDLFIPPNFRPRNYTGAGNSFTGGNKVLALFSDSYSGQSPTMLLGSWYKQNGPGSGTGDFWHNSSMRWMNQAGVQTRMDMPWDSGIDLDGLPPIYNMSIDLNQHQRHICHFKMPDSATSNNGVWEFWVTHSNGVTDKLIDVHNGSWYGANPNSTGGNYINRGYLLGAAGTLWNEDMVMSEDDIVIADTNIWGVV